MNKTIAFLLSAFVSLTCFAEETTCKKQDPTSITEFDLGSDRSFTFKFCNNHPVAKVYENSVVTSDGGNFNYREMKGFVVRDVMEIPACSCSNVRVTRDEDDELENNAGFFWVSIDEVEPSVSIEETPGNVIRIKVAMMPVIHYGNIQGEIARLSAQLSGKKLLVSNAGKRPGRVVGIKIGNQVLDISKYFVLPGKEVDVAGLLPISIDQILASKKRIALIDSLGQEIAVRQE